MYHRTIDHLFDWFGISCMTTDIFCFYLQNRLIQTNQAGVLLSPLVFPSLIKDSSDLAVDKQVPILTKLLSVRLHLGLYRAA